MIPAITYYSQHSTKIPSIGNSQHALFFVQEHEFIPDTYLSSFKHATVSWTTSSKERKVSPRFFSFSLDSSCAGILGESSASLWNRNVLLTGWWSSPAHELLVWLTIEGASKNIEVNFHILTILWCNEEEGNSEGLTWPQQGTEGKALIAETQSRHNEVRARCRCTDPLISGSHTPKDEPGLRPPRQRSQWATLPSNIGSNTYQTPDICIPKQFMCWLH